MYLYGYLYVRIWVVRTVSGLAPYRRGDVRDRVSGQQRGPVGYVC